MTRRNESLKLRLPRPEPVSGVRSTTPAEPTPATEPTPAAAVDVPRTAPRVRFYFIAHVISFQGRPCSLKPKQPGPAGGFKWVTK